MMEIKSSIEKVAEDIGYDIGMSDDETQAKLLNGFARALMNRLTDNDRNTQICYFVDKLEKRNNFVFEAIAEFIKLRDAEK